LVGEDNFLRGMRHYAETWRYRHPYPQDFFDAFQAGARIDNIAWYFEQAFRSTATLDWRVEVEQKRMSEPRGWFTDSTGAWVERKRETKPDDGEGRDGDAKKPDASWDVEVVVRRKGTMLLPLTIELTWDGGEKEQLTWARDEQARSTWWKPLEGRPRGPKKLVAAVIDPERRYSFDKDMSDNQWYEAVDDVAPLRWSERVFEQYAALMHWWGGIGG
jgi:hypothetical protein